MFDCEMDEIYPNKIITYITKSCYSRDIPDIPINKYSLPSSYTIQDIIELIKNKIQLSPRKHLVIFINNELQRNNVCLIQIYNKYKDTDGILRLVYMDGFY